MVCIRVHLLPNEYKELTGYPPVPPTQPDVMIVLLRDDSNPSASSSIRERSSPGPWNLQPKGRNGVGKGCLKKPVIAWWRQENSQEEGDEGTPNAIQTRLGTVYLGFLSKCDVLCSNTAVSVYTKFCPVPWLF